MISRRIYLTVLLVGALALAGLISPRSAEAQFKTIVTLKEALKESLQKEGAKSLRKQVFAISDEQKIEIQKQYGFEPDDEYLMYTGLDAEKEPVGSVLVINIQGKEGPLQMVIALTPESGTVYNLGFTVFGEERGKPAANPSYLSQFIGADSNKGFVLGEDVDAVTGATWTSRSVNEAVKVAVVVYEYLIIQGKGEESP